MKSCYRQAGLGSLLLLMALLGGTGCSPSASSVPAAVAQTANQKTDGFVQPAVAAPRDHEFVYQADGKLKSVSLVGSFNKWDKSANPMKVDVDGLTWRLALPLDVGRYVYKFVLFGAGGDETWIPDPHEPLDETDQANDNSLLLVKSVADVPANPNDGKTDVAALSHPHGVQDINYDARVLALSLRARTNDLRHIWLRSAGRKYPMKLVRRESFYSYYEVKLPWNRAHDLSYDFELQDGNRIETYGADGLNPKSRPFTIFAKIQPYFLSPAPQPLKMKGPLTTQRVAGPPWAKNQPIYEVNLDLYGFPKGAALRDFEKHLPVLKEMGVGLLWFMPLHPRGQKKAFGSPYAVRDFTDINPDFGTKAEFRHLVERAHQLGMRVLVDWVANHTSWDNPLIAVHPEFYEKDGKGEIVQAGSWPDVAQLDYGKLGQWNQPLWNLMRDDMKLWIREFGIDGFRCDVAGSGGKIPVEFWNWLHPQLNAVKPVFMLAEGDDPYLHPAFDMTYSWNLPPVLWDVCAGRRPATAIDEQLRKEARRYPVGAIRMRFLDNHDWHGNADWGWGNGAPIDTSKGLPQVAPLMVLCATLPGKPLLYNGQEMSYLKTNPPLLAEARRQTPVWTFYHRLLHLYGSQPAIVEGDFTKIVSDHDDTIYAFTRQRASTRILVVVNLSDRAQTVSLKDASLAGNYRDWFSDTPVKLSASPSLQLAPWDYRVYVTQQ